MATFKNADVPADLDGAEPLGYGEAFDGCSEHGGDVCDVDAVASGGRRRKDVS